MDHPYIVIGSGPAGVSCAVALLEQGCRVLMIDGGADLEPGAAQKLTVLGGTPPSAWTREATAWMREGMQSSAEGIPLKLTYGSDYPFRSMPGAPVIEGEGINTKISLGKGGLSAVWGTSVMPFRQHDIESWPVTADELAPHFRAVLDFMPVAQTVDDLEPMFPTFKASEPMPLGAQAAALLQTMKSHEQELRAQGVTVGRSRLAINALGKDAPGACVKCALCMYGCPYGLLYSSGQTVDALKGNPKFTYAPGFVVQRVEEVGGEVRVHAVNSQAQAETLVGDRVFVAAGVLASTAMMLRSLEKYDQPVTFADAFYFLLPMMRLKSVPGFTRGDVHTLAQLFVEVMDEALTDKTIHLQLYTYNDLFDGPIAQKLGPAAKVFPWNAFLSRLNLFQGFLHSDDSPKMEGRLQRTGSGDSFRLTSAPHPETDVLLKKIITKLTKMRKYTGMIPLVPLMQRGDPGRGFHTGGSLPMSAKPTGMETDLLGRPVGLNRVHVVDSSVLPSIAATTITFTAMANAHRIGSLVAQGVSE